MEQSPNTPTTDGRENEVDVDVALSVVGEKGPRGDQGLPGIPGTPGKPGPRGEQGSTGVAVLIADRAREIAASSRAGSDLDNWLTAEREVLTRSSAPTGERGDQGANPPPVTRVPPVSPVTRVPPVSPVTRVPPVSPATRVRPATRVQPARRARPDCPDSWVSAARRARRA